MKYANGIKSVRDRLLTFSTASVMVFSMFGTSLPFFLSQSVSAAPDLASPIGLSFTDPATVCGGATSSPTITADWDSVDPGDSTSVTYNYRVWTDAAGSSYNSPATAFEADGNTTTSQAGDFNQGEGLYTFEVQTVDTADSSISAWSNPCSVSYDTTAPTVSVNPVAGSLLHGTETFDITINDANPATPANSNVFVELFNANPPQAHVGQDVNLSSGTGSFTVDTTKLSDGSAWLDVEQVKDAAGNVSPGDNYFKNYTIDNTAPTGLSNLSPASGTITNTTTTKDITWTTATDPDSPVSYYYESSNSSATNANGSFVSPIYTSGALSATQIPIAGTADGTYYWHIRAVDSLGNSTAWTTPWKIIVDNTAPVVTVTPVAGPLLHGTEKFNITINDANPASSANSNVWVNLYDVNGNPQKNVGAHVDLSSGSGVFTIDTTKLNDGSAWLDVEQVQDAAGNVSPGDNYFKDYTVDNNVPGAPTLITPFDHSFTNDNTPFLSWLPATSKTNPPLTYDVQISNDNFATILVDHKGSTLSYNDTQKLADGTYEVRVMSTDILGGTSTWSGTHTFTVDTVSPSVLITSPKNNAVVKGSVPVTGTMTDLNPTGYAWTITNSQGHIVYFHLFSGSTVSPLSLGSLADGTYTIYLEGFDAALNHSTDSIKLTVDNTAPIINVNTLPLSSSSTPTITGTIDDPTATITVSLDGGTPFAATNHGDGTWGVVAPSLPDGKYTILATATDIAGNIGTGLGSIAVDAHQPGTPKLITPFNDSYTNDNTPFLSWLPSFSKTNPPVTYDVQLSTSSTDFSSPVFETTTSTPFATSSKLADGIYYERLQASDSLGGLSSWSSVHKFTVDTTDPTAVITPPANGTIIKNSAKIDGTISDTNLTGYSWAITNSKGHTVYFHLFGGSSVNPLNLSGLADGNYTIYLESFDAALNHSIDSLQITIDDTAPTISVTSSGLTTDNTPTLTGTVNDLNTAVVEVTINNKTYTVTNNNTTWSLTIPHSDRLSDGPYTISATATDPAGNTATATGNIIVDAHLPGKPSIINPNDHSYTNDNKPNFSWKPSTEKFKNPAVSYILEVSKNSNFSTVIFSTPVTGTSYSGESSLSDGVYYVRVKAIDAFTGQSDWSDVHQFTVDTIRPFVQITSPSNGAILNGAITISGKVHDLNLAHSSWTITGPGYNDKVNNSASFSWDSTTHSDGVYTIKLSAKDKAGNFRERQITITIDNTAPTGLSNLSPANGTITNTANLTAIAWNAASDPHGPVTYIYESSNSAATNPDGSFVTPIFTSGAITATKISTVGTPAGTYYWHVEAMDSLGNTSVWTNPWKVIVDDTNPVITVTSQTTTNTEPTVSGTVSKLVSSLKVTIDGTVYTANVSNVANVGGTFNWTISVTSPLAVNTYDVDATATDLASNVGADNAVGALVISALPIPAVTPTVTKASPQVLGASTGGSNTTGTTPTGTGGKVLGAHTSNSGNSNGNSGNSKTDNINHSNRFLGLGWWWLLILAAILGAWWFLLAKRRKKDDEEN